MYTTKDSGLIWFAFRIIHRIINTNVYLNKLKISDDKYCSICLHEPESITQLFFHCPLVARIWSSLSYRILHKIGKRIQFDKETVIYGQMSDAKIIHLIIMSVKKCIFSLLRKKNRLLLLILWDIQKHITHMKKEIIETDVFLKRWSILNLLNAHPILFFPHAT